MANKTWLRLYTEITRDRKIRRLPVEYRWIWIAVLCMAKESPQPGRLLLSEEVPVEPEDIADEAGIEIEDVHKALGLFEKQQMIHYDGDVLVVTNWEQRQFSSDSSTERVKEYRERRRKMGVTVTGYEKFRDEVFARYGSACVYCGSTSNLVLDHVVPILLGGDDHPDNLVVACKRCNSGKAGRMPEQAGYKFVSKLAAEVYKKNLKRLQVNGVTVSETPPDTDTDTEYISTSKEKEIKKDTTLLLSNSETEKAGNIVVSSPSLLSKQEQANVLLQEFGSIKGVTKKDDDVPFFVGLVDECGYDVVKQAVDILKYAIEEKGDKISNPRAYLRGTAVSKKNAARRKPPRPTQRLPDYTGRDAPII